MTTALVQNVEARFRKVFAEEPMLVRSPGRVNLIGEHTDYNHGFVLPAAIDKAICMAVSRRDDQGIHIYSHDMGRSYIGNTGEIIRSGIGWPDYILGVVWQLQQHGHTIGGFNCVFGGDIPIGAGMSSSAALECATIWSLNELFGLKLDPMTMVKWAQKAENNFVGMQCGIMDQFASMFGRRDHVIRLDCDTLEYQYVPFRMDGFRIVLLDSNVKHELVASEYNTRRRQCEEGVRLIREGGHSQIKSLRDCTLEMLNKYVKTADPLVYQRCRFVVEENQRLLAACDDLDKGDIPSFGQRMFVTHDGLSKQYEVSCPELDYLVDKVRGRQGVLGARMMGGGFGGCTINLIEEDRIEELVAEIAGAYSRDMGRELKVYISQIENGTSLIG